MRITKAFIIGLRNIVTPNDLYLSHNAINQSIIKELVLRNSSFLSAFVGKIGFLLQDKSLSSQDTLIESLRMLSKKKKDEVKH